MCICVHMKRQFKVHGFQLHFESHSSLGLPWSMSSTNGSLFVYNNKYRGIQLSPGCISPWGFNTYVENLSANVTESNITQ